MIGFMMVTRQVATTAAVMSYDDVFRITAAVTLLAFLPAMFLKTTRTKHGGGPSVLVD